MTGKMGLKRFIESSKRLAGLKADHAFARAIGADRQLIARWLGKTPDAKNRDQSKIDHRFDVEIQKLTGESDAEYWGRKKREMARTED